MPLARRSTSGRSRGSYRARRPSRLVVRSGGGFTGKPLTSTLVSAIITVALIGAFLAATAPGQSIAAGVLRFLLFYGGVFALIAMTAAVAIGLVATDRIVMSAGGRVIAQAVHRAISLAALVFLIIHIALEIAAERSQAADAVVPFLARHRTFYTGLGTIASDLILIIMVSGYLRSRFAHLSRPWAWRAVHASAYLAWLLAIIHGLLGGRTAKPYVDWSYGTCVAAVGLALAVRAVAAHRSRGEVAADPAAARPSGWPALPPGFADAGLDQPSLPAGALRRPPRRALPAGTSGSQDASGRPAPAVTEPSAGRPAPAVAGLRTGLPDVTGPLAAAAAAEPPAADPWADLQPASGWLHTPPSVRSPWDDLRPAAPVPGTVRQSPLSGLPPEAAWGGAGPARAAWEEPAQAWGEPAPAWGEPAPAWGEPAPAWPGGSSRPAWDDPGPARPAGDHPRAAPSAWDDLPARSPWDNLRAEDEPPPAPPARLAGPPASPGSGEPAPLPRRTPGRRHSYRGPGR